MILLAAVERLAEAIGAGERAAAGKRMPEPHTHNAGLGLRIDARPVDLSGLQLHHPCDAFDGPVIRTTKRHTVLPAEAKAFRPKVVAAAHRIKRERDEVQIGRAPRVSAADVDDVVGCDPLRRRDLLAQPRGLLIQKAPGLIGGEAAKVEHRMRADTIKISWVGDAYLF